MDEAALKQSLCNTFRLVVPAAMTFRHEDRAHIGLPDITFTWKGFTTWIEVKYARPRLLKGRDVQTITRCRLANVGRCFYVIYREKAGVKSTLVLHPKTVFEGEDDFTEVGPSERVFSGFSHHEVVMFIRSTHNGGHDV